MVLVMMMVMMMMMMMMIMINMTTKDIYMDIRQKIKRRKRVREKGLCG